MGVVTAERADGEIQQAGGSQSCFEHRRQIRGMARQVPARKRQMLATLQTRFDCPRNRRVTTEDGRPVSGAGVVEGFR